jgi:acyl carrier protein
MVNELAYDDVAKVLIECLNSLGNDHRTAQISPETSVIRQWDLHSEDGVDLAADLEIQLEIEIPHDENPLIAESRTGQKRARSFDEVVRYLLNRKRSESN